MLQQIIRWLLGDVTFRISGQSPWYFLSRAAKMGFGLWGMEERKDGVFAHVGRGVWPKLSQLAASSGCTLEKIEESGPYGILLRLWGRKGLIVGFVLACLLLRAYPADADPRLPAEKCAGLRKLPPQRRAARPQRPGFPGALLRPRRGRGAHGI